MATIDIDPDTGGRAVDRAESVWSKLRYHAASHPLGVVGAVIMLVFVFAAVFADLDHRATTRSPTNPRDLAAAAERGAHRSAPTPWAATSTAASSTARASRSRSASARPCSAALFGVALGLASGYIGGWVDLIIQRIVDVLQAVPLLVLALVMAAALGPALDNTIVAIAIPLIPYTARVIRSNTLALREQPFVEAARAVGMSEFRIAVRHVLPNTLAPLIVHRDRAARRRDPDRGVAVVPRPRRAGAASVLGPHAVGIGRRICAHRALAGDLPGRRHQPRGVRHQSARRRAARHPRSAAARLMTLA